MRTPRPTGRVTESTDRSGGAHEPEPGRESAPGVHIAEIRCDTCGRVTIHRIVCWDPRHRNASNHFEGLAKCRVCSWTHPFQVRPPTETTIDLIVSRGAVSERTAVRAPASQELRVGSAFPGVDLPLTVRKLEAVDGGPVPCAPASTIRTVWAVPATEHRLRVSILEGARTRPVESIVDPATIVTVGEDFPLDEGTIRVIALRAQGRTWKLSGDRFPARVIQRVYGRRIERPPAGSSDWRSEREMLRSRASSTSRSARSRSSPGVRRSRTSPRRRSASAGATVQ